MTVEELAFLAEIAQENELKDFLEWIEEMEKVILLSH